MCSDSLASGGGGGCGWGARGGEARLLCSDSNTDTVARVPPSVKFELYLLNFLGSASADKAYGEYARYSLNRLEEALDLDGADTQEQGCMRGQ